MQHKDMGNKDDEAAERHNKSPMPCNQSATEQASD